MPKKFSSEYQPKNRKSGPNEKTLAWERLGEMVVNEGAERYQKFLEGLDDKKFAEEFKAILEYFKPRQQRTELKHEGDVEFRHVDYTEKTDD